MNEQNLIDNSKRSPKEVRENGRKGGIASGESRRQKKTWRMIAEELGNMAVINEKQQKGLQKFFKLNGETTHDTLVIARAYSEAANGNVQAMRFIADLKGEITQRHDIEQRTDLNVSKINVGKLPDDILFKMVEALDDIENNNE